MSAYPYPPFSGVGIEIEHMIVDAETLRVSPVADRLLESAIGSPGSELERGPIHWSNELTLHVIEMKTAEPVSDLSQTARDFRENTREMLRLLAPLGARLMPTGMHPLMNPDQEMRLWPHENDIIYKTFDRLFDCRGQGWANLQSVHINLPFQTDEDFGRVHAAARAVLPLIPGLAASSPIALGKRAPSLDFRVDVYRNNARRVPSISGLVVPERAYTRADYEQRILGKIYSDLAPLDPEGILQHEWANARGAIARFDRGSIEIRLIDTQECPEQDIAIVHLVTEVCRLLAELPPRAMSELMDLDEVTLHAVLLATMREGSAAVLPEGAYLGALGISGARTAREAWQALAKRIPSPDRALAVRLDVILEQGTLSERMLRTLDQPLIGHRVEPAALQALSLRLCDCLSSGMAFEST